MGLYKSKEKPEKDRKFASKGSRFRTEDFFLPFLLCRRVIVEPWGNTVQTLQGSIQRPRVEV